MRRLYLLKFPFAFGARGFSFRASATSGVPLWLQRCAWAVGRWVHFVDSISGR